MGESTFDIELFRTVFERGNPEDILAFYADDLEHIEIDQDAPPRSPRMGGIDGIRAAFEELAQAGIRLKMENVVAASDRAACTITCAFPDGRRLLSNTIYDLRDGKIAGQLDIQVTDPE